MINSKQNFINKKLFSPYGRIPRKSFFLVNLVALLLYIVLLCFSSFAEVILEDYAILSLILAVIFLACVILLGCASFFAWIKRSRDAGFSDFWSSVSYFLPIVNFFWLFMLLFKGSIPLPQASAAQNLENKN